jgi:hypothetical protein
LWRVLCRVDTRTGTVEKIANAISTGRFPALAIRDGMLCRRFSPR